ncbi:MAG: putative ArsR family transcriptional regulator [Frankiales bacterium]|nr:putative ArsR family transcriptional regulator [Frankiales bacterium]
MTSSNSRTDGPSIDVFKALSDPIRWSILTQIAAVDELPCATLETTLPVSKPTISYHTKLLQQAGLLEVRKEGRNYYYALRRDALQEVVDELWQLAPAPRPVSDEGVPYESAASRARSERAAAASKPSHRRTGRRAVGDDDVVVLTW